MSFETIFIERRQPIYDKRFVKPPSAEDGEQPLVTIDEIESNIDSSKINTLSFGRGKEYRGIFPNFTNRLNLDFMTYDEVGLSGNTNDIQEEIREIARSKSGANEEV